MCMASAVVALVTIALWVVYIILEKIWTYLNFNWLSYYEHIFVIQFLLSQEIEVMKVFRFGLVLQISKRIYYLPFLFIEHREHGELRVPLSITVEIVPASIHAWCHVQGQAHNPRVRVTTPLQRPLAALISHLQEKWRRSELKLVSFGFTNFDQSLFLPSSSFSSLWYCIIFPLTPIIVLSLTRNQRETLSSRATFPVNLEDVKEKVLRILPPKGTVIKPISVQVSLIVMCKYLSCN